MSERNQILRSHHRNQCQNPQPTVTISFYIEVEVPTRMSAFSDSPVHHLLWEYSAY